MQRIGELMTTIKNQSYNFSLETCLAWVSGIFENCNSLDDHYEDNQPTNQ